MNAKTEAAGKEVENIKGYMYILILFSWFTVARFHFEATIRHLLYRHLQPGLNVSRCLLLGAN